MKSIGSYIRALTTIILFGFSLSLYANGTSNQTHKDESASSTYNASEDTRRKIRLGFTAPSTMHRQLLLTEDVNATSGVDWGYDSEYYDTGYEDAYWLIEDQKFTIQGVNSFDASIDFPLGFHVYEDGMCSIRIDGLENVSEDFDVYIFDKELNVFKNLREENYEFYASQGEYLDRFDLIVNSQLPLEITDHHLNNLKFTYNKSNQVFTIHNPNDLELLDFSLYNMLGQLVYHKRLNAVSLKEELRLNNLKIDTSILVLNTQTGKISKKILLN